MTRENVMIARITSATLRVRTDTRGVGVGMQNLQKGMAELTSVSQQKIKNQRIGVRESDGTSKEGPARENRDRL